MDTNEEYLFDDYFDEVNLNEELKSFYGILNNEDATKEFNLKIELTKIRNDNYKRYNNINLLEIKDLINELDLVKEIQKLYHFIQPNIILISDLEQSNEIKKILDLIDKYYNELFNKIKKELDILEKENNLRQEKIKKLNYNNVDKKVLEKVLRKYNDLVLFNSTIDNNIIDNYKRQLKRKKYINDLYKYLNIEVENNIDNDELEELNRKINFGISKINTQILYLQDIMINKSKHKQEFSVFINYFNDLIAYDDKNYIEVSRVYNSIFNDLKIESLLNYFEESFIKEIEDIRRESNFIYNRYGIKNIKSSLNYISANYMDFITDDEKALVNSIYNAVKKENYNIDEIHYRFKLLSNSIWRKSVTDVYSYNKDDFCFLCTNNEFIDEKHQCILITNKMLERVNDYSDYQIGFICNYNDNILYVTENQDIMSISHDDMSKFKTPKQIEQEFLNFKVSNRIALNGYITKFDAVYYIDDGDLIKYKKSVEMANQYNLPLIVLKKEHK